MKKLITTCEEKEDISVLKEAGASAVCFALNHCSFSVLKGLDIEEVKDTAEAAHKEGMELRILMNRLFMQEEIRHAQEQMDLVMEAGADAVVFADPGLLHHALKKGYAEKLIYRSETMTTSANDVLWFSSLGLKGVMVSPLLTREEISEIASKTKHCGMMIHGYLPESISRRTLVSAFGTSVQTEGLRGRKGLWLRELKREGRMPVCETEFGTIIHTDYVQESFGFVSAFADAGIETFEINGEYLPKEAVRDAVEAYKLIFNGADAAMIEAAYRNKWASLPLESGYYGQKTVR